MAALAAGENTTTTTTTTTTSSSLILPTILGLGFGSLLLAAPQSLKPLSSAVALAGAAAKATAALRSPPRALLFASKALLKTFKPSQHGGPSPPSRLKSYLAALNLARYSLLAGGGSLGLGHGYKISKNLARVLEGLVGIQLDSAVRSRVIAVGVMVKAAVVTELLQRLAAGAGFSDSKSTVCFRYKRIELGIGVADVGGFSSRKLAPKVMAGDDTSEMPHFLLDAAPQKPTFELGIWLENMSPPYEGLD